MNKEKRTVVRFSQEQLDYHSVMGKLIDLYYFLKSIKNLGIAYDEILKRITNILSILIPVQGNLSFIGAGRSHYFRYYYIWYNKEHDISISIIMMEPFIWMMEAFYDDLKNDRLNENTYVITGAYNRYNLIHQGEGNAYKEETYIFDIESNLKMRPKFCDMSRLCDMDIYMGEEVKPPYAVESGSFCDCIPFIFAKYHFLFGSFKRIKICKRDSCKKMYIEKKEGSGKYCSGNCRHFGTYPELTVEQKKCMRRQNTWIDRKISSDDYKNKCKQRAKEKLKDEIQKYPFFIDRKECAECKQASANEADEVKGGHCEKLKENNSVAFALFPELKRTRKTHALI